MKMEDDPASFWHGESSGAILNLRAVYMGLVRS